ncbi:MAG TPA: IS630 family transposase, partial [Nitrosospira sp.]|nr:IS630 family transposase [Nitrosospira sp.]
SCEEDGRIQMRVAAEIVLTPEEYVELTALVRSKLTSVRLALRARIVLLAAKGLQNKDIAAQVGVGRVQVSRWRERYAQSRLAGIERDLPRGAPPVKVDVARLMELTTESKPDAATHWSTRTMAAELGVSAASISRHWRAKGLKPHLVRSFKVSRDPKFIEKLEDIVGLYLAPPEHAIVLCCDEKSQVQALDRTQPGLPLKKGRAATMTHEKETRDRPRFSVRLSLNWYWKYSCRVVPALPYQTYPYISSSAATIARLVSLPKTIIVST